MLLFGGPRSVVAAFCVWEGGFDAARPPRGYLRRAGGWGTSAASSFADRSPLPPNQTNQLRRPPLGLWEATSVAEAKPGCFRTGNDWGRSNRAALTLPPPLRNVRALPKRGWLKPPFARLAQLDRALASEAKGQRFESSTAHQTKKPGIVRCRAFLFGAFEQPQAWYSGTWNPCPRNRRRALSTTTGSNRTPRCCSISWSANSIPRLAR